ncbi:anaerobic ribonucleoside-triphosphate reductase-activating protein [Pantoea sp. 1.19]|uniref:anaerobic ribonucleoside-triphosphate reductase-activating protein n=1 Tax=Pantoea sp. 1.19 TaxID=1925589 RepID=UPI000948B854|nr:anaerobic ribonucleoside-triphosphate reductase-activating protein [Pantoea sp. 1.19]
MYYHAYYPLDVVNGPGTRCTLFVAGCAHRCPGCYNRSTWRIDSGRPFTAAVADRLLADLGDRRIPRQGLSLSGGDPLHPANVAEIARLVTRVRQAYPQQDIWLWTGYRLAELNAAQRAILPWLDVLIDGRFEQDLADPGLIWRGSRNQVIHRLR